MTTRNQNRYNNAINQMSEMSNFAPLPSTTPPATSATPGPPPFHITRTPLFVHRSPYYDIHPETLRDMNGPTPNDFDEGYPWYDNFSKGEFTHRTLVASPITRNPDPKPTPPKPKPKPIDEVTQQSPSLLRPITKKPSDVPHFQSIERQKEGDPHLYHEPSWFSELNAALNRMGINQTTTILIIIAVFIAVQINQYNQDRNVHRTIASNPSREGVASYITEEKMNQLLRKQQADFDKKLNETIEAIQNNTQDLHQQVTQNTAGIVVNKDNITTAKHEIIQNAERTDEIAHDLRHKADITDVQDTLDWFEDRSTTNWISGIVDMPPTIPYSFNEDHIVNHTEKEQPKTPGFDFFATVKRGMELYHNETKGGGNKDETRYQLRSTANMDITESATPYTLRPADCLQFEVKKEERWIEMSLIERIIPTEFEYIHMDKAQLRMEDRNKSPKRFMLFGKVRGGNWSDIAVKEDKILGINESSIQLSLDTQSGIEMMRIEYDVNPDAKTTRIYRMKVHGIPDVYG